MANDNITPERARKYIISRFDKAGYLRKYNPTLYDNLVNFGVMGISRKQHGRGLFITGDVGIGKTFGLKTLADIFFDLGDKWEFRTAQEIQDFYAATADTQPQEWKEYCKGRAGYSATLIIDDLGTEDYPFIQYGTRKNPLAEMLYFRYDTSYHRDLTRTIITSNLTNQEFLERYGERASDRLKEMCIPLTISGKSARGLDLPPPKPTEPPKPPEKPATPEEMHRIFEDFLKTLRN